MTANQSIPTPTKQRPNTPPRSGFVQQDGEADTPPLMKFVVAKMGLGSMFFVSEIIVPHGGVQLTFNVRPRMKRCIAWDFDGTLAWRPGMWAGALAEAAADEGHTVSAEFFRPLLQQGFPWHSPDITRSNTATADSWWSNIEPLFSRALSAVEGIDSQTASRASMAVRRIYCDPDGWRVFDDVVPALQELSSDGWLHVILSNHVPDLDDIVCGLNLEGHFDAVISSGTTGIEKPHPVAFDFVRKVVGQDTEVVMVGDSWRADICGATSSGLEAVLVRNCHPEALLQCANLGDLGEILMRRTSGS